MLELLWYRRETRQHKEKTNFILHFGRNRSTRLKHNLSGAYTSGADVTLRPDVIIKGGDWKEENVVGRGAVRTWDGQVVIIGETEGTSTTNIVAKVLEVYGRN